jgi:hypothetical protein
MPNKPYDFIRKTSAKALEINACYDTLYDFLNAYYITGELEPENNITATMPCIYISSIDGKIYKKTGVGSTNTGWVELGISEESVIENFILKGNTPPSNSLGEIGYLYQDLIAGKFYKKISELEGNTDSQLFENNFTSNSQNGYILSGYGEDETNPYLALDGNLTTYSRNDSTDALAILIQMPESKICNKIKVWIPEDYANIDEHLLKEFNFSGKNGIGGDWTNFISESNYAEENWIKGAWNEIVFINTAAFDYYELFIAKSYADIGDGHGKISVNELQLWNSVAIENWQEIKTTNQYLNTNSSVIFNSMSCNSININSTGIQEITGNNSNTVLNDLLTALVGYGLIINSVEPELEPQEPRQLFINNFSSNSNVETGSLFDNPARAYSGTNLYNVVDGNMETYLNSFTYYGDVFWWGVVLNTPDICNMLKIFTPTDPTNVRWGFVLQGTNEESADLYDNSSGVQYDSLFDTLLDIPADYSEWNVNDFTEFNFENTTAYKVYRIKRKGDVEGYATRLHEVEFWNNPA